MTPESSGGTLCAPRRAASGNVLEVGLDPKQHARAIVRRSGTSFFWSMRLLPRAKREAMFAIYAFCREVDDVADGDLALARKLEQLQRWRDEVGALYAGRPTRPTARALLEPVERFDLPRSEFEAMIDGMEIDARGGLLAPPMAVLESYCRCVAGAVGLLSIRVFGARAPAREAGARALGEALQLTNILRDLGEDARVGRLYLPAELLAAEGIGAGPPETVLRDARLPAACAALADRAERRFAEAAGWLAEEDRRDLRPALLMMHVYRTQLARTRAAGWRDPARPVRLGKPTRLWLALRHGLF